MNKQINTTQRIRSLINKGYNNKDIIAKLECKPQTVYTIRYQLNKERGLGSIGALPKPTDGIGVPPKRKYTRRIKAGELASPPTMPHFTPSPSTTVKPTLWQRIKGWFGG
jgi:hypothetical protein